MTERHYGGAHLPPSAKLVDEATAKSFAEAIDQLYEIRAAPSERFPNAELLVPRTACFCLVPGDLELRDEDDGFDDELIFDAFFDRLDEECFFWNSFGNLDVTILFASRYSSVTRQWMMNARVKDNLGITSIQGSFSIVADILVRSCIISGPGDLVERFEEAWGGRSKLEADFLTHVQTLPRSENREWAMQHLVPLLGLHRGS